MAVGETPAGTVAAKATTAVALGLPIEHTERWSPGSPSLYTARAEVLSGGRVVDSESTTFGVRELTWDGDGGFRLNGEPVKIVGANVHHDHGPMGAAALGRSEERRVEILKQGGFNAIRTVHNAGPGAARRLRPARHAGDGRAVRRLGHRQEPRRLLGPLRTVVAAGPDERRAAGRTARRSPRPSSRT